MPQRTAELPDHDARRRAATDFESNLVVFAGAGTGKTSLLVERVLNLLGSGRLTVEELAAITFTEKAAGEMRERIAEGLDRLRSLAIADEPAGATGSGEADRAFAHLVAERKIDRETIADHALTAMEQLDRSHVTTIHGFCSELLRSYPREATVVPDFVVDSGEQAELVLRESWDSFVATELGRDPTAADDWRELLARYPLAKISTLIGAMADFGIPNECLSSSQRQDPAGSLLADEARLLADELQRLLETPSGLTRSGRALISESDRVLRTLADEGVTPAQGLLDSLETMQKYVLGRTQRPKPAKAADDETAAEYNRLASESITILRTVHAIDDDACRLLTTIGRRFADGFRETLLRRGFVGFDGLLLLARNLLRDCHAVRHSVKQRFRTLLVDEFQDTDPLQYEIVLLLAERQDEESGDPWRTNLQPGRLFVVGDAKQSIYRFRGADYSAYSRAVDRIVEASGEGGGDKLELFTNFRSPDTILDPINRLFLSPAGCWSRSDQQPEYVVIHPAEEAGADLGRPAVEIWSPKPGVDAKVSSARRRENEGRAIAREIQTLVEKEGYHYSDFSVLFYALTQVGRYLRPLREFGLPFVVDGGREFLKRPEVGQLLATLQTVAQPSDPVALLAFLRAPAGGVPDRDLAAYAAEGLPWDWRFEPDKERHGHLARCFDLLRSLRSETLHLPADAAVRRVVERTRQLPFGAAAFEGPQRVANLRKLATAAGVLARDGKLSLEEVVEALREGRLAEINTDSPLADDAIDAVRLTSIHRMKGLENRVVIVPDLARGDSRSQRESETVEIARPGNAAPILALRIGGTCNTASAWWDREQHRHEEAEEIRLLYVALTRARERLVLLANRPSGRGAWLRALAPWGYDVDEPPTTEGPLADDDRVSLRFSKTDGPGQEPRATDTLSLDDAVENYDHARRRAAEPPALRFVSPSELGEEDDTHETGVAAGGRPDVARAVGELVHRLLEGWDLEDGDLLHRKLTAACPVVAQGLSVDQDALENDCREIIGAFLSGPLAQRLRRCTVVDREIPLLSNRGDGTVVRGNIDLLYRDEDDRLVIADYKTGRDTDEERLRQRHGAQLRAYAQGVRTALDLDDPPAAELWILRHGLRIVVDTKPSP